MARLPTVLQAAFASALVGLGCTGTIQQTDPVPENPGAGPGTSSGPGGGPTASPASSAPGVAQLRRLTVLEYRNTVRDLLGLKPTPEFEAWMEKVGSRKSPRTVARIQSPTRSITVSHRSFPTTPLAFSCRYTLDLATMTFFSMT